MVTVETAAYFTTNFQPRVTKVTLKLQDRLAPHSVRTWLKAREVQWDSLGIAEKPEWLTAAIEQCIS
jgi:hypothetical protein